MTEQVAGHGPSKELVTGATGLVGMYRLAWRLERGWPTVALKVSGEITVDLEKIDAAIRDYWEEISTCQERPEWARQRVLDAVPEMEAEEWALDEALTRYEIMQAGGELEFGKHYSGRSKFPWVKEEIGETPKLGDGEEEGDDEEE